MKLLKISLLALTFFVLNTTVFGQKKITEGLVKYEITDIESDMAELAMLKGTEVDMYFTAAKQKVDFAIMGGLMRVQTIIDNNATDKNIMLMDMMGKKIQIDGMKEEDIQKNPMMSLGGGEQTLEYKINKKEKKKIAGYKCCKATAELPQGMQMIVYFTKKIKPKDSFISKAMGGLDGFPLEFVVETGMGMALTFTAQEVKGDVDPSNFEVPAGYDKMTLEELQEELGGLGGLGF